MSNAQMKSLNFAVISRDVNKTSTFKTKTKTKTPDLKPWTKTAHGTK